MATIGTLTANLVANTAKFERDMGRAERLVKSSSSRMNIALGKIDKGFGRITKSVGRMVKGMFSLRGIIGTVAGTAGLGLLLKRALDTADAIGKQADAIGIGTTALQTYRHAAELSGVASEALDKAFRKASRTFGELGRSSSELSTGLRDLDPTMLANLRTAGSFEKQLDVTFRTLAKIENQTRKNAVANIVFGRSGVEMTNIVRDGFGALTEMREEAVTLGLVLDESLVRGAEAANDQLERMGKILSTNLTRLLVSQAPAIIRLGDAFIKLAPAVRSFVDSLLPAEFVGLGELTRRIDELLEARLKLTAGIEHITDLEAREMVRRARAVQAIDLEIIALVKLSETRRAETAAVKRALAGGDGTLGQTAQAAAGKIDALVASTANLQEQLDALASGGRSALDALDLVKWAQQASAALAGLSEEDLAQLAERFAALGGVGRNAAEMYADLAGKAAEAKSAVAESTKAIAAQAKAFEKFLAGLRKTRIARDDFIAGLATQNKMLALSVAGQGDLIPLLEAEARLRDILGRDLLPREAEELRGLLDEQGRLTEVLGRQEEALGRARRAAENFGHAIGTAFEDAVLSGQGLRGILHGLAQDIQRIILRMTVTAPLQKLVTGALGGLFGGGGGLGPQFTGVGTAALAEQGSFAHGGSFRVPGSGGTDSRLVQFRATPGERVTVETPAQARAAGGGTYYIDATGADAEGLQRLESLIVSLDGSIERRSLAVVIGESRRQPRMLG